VLTDLLIYQSYRLAFALYFVCMYFVLSRAGSIIDLWAVELARLIELN
jgi:hypothetical protein